MKLQLRSLLSSLLLAVPVSAGDGHLLFSVPRASSPGEASAQLDRISPKAAGLVIAQRLGLAHYHSIAGVDDDTLAAVNRWSSRRRALFQNENLESRDLIFVSVESVAEPEELIPVLSAANRHHVTVSNIPLRETSTFEDGLRLQAEFDARKADDLLWVFGHARRLLTSTSVSSFVGFNCSHPALRRSFCNFTGLKQAADRHGSESEEYKSATRDIQGMLTSLIEAAELDHTQLVVLMKPPGDATAANEDSYNFYAVPSASDFDALDKANVVKRQVGDGNAASAGRPPASGTSARRPHAAQESSSTSTTSSASDEASSTRASSPTSTTTRVATSTTSTTSTRTTPTSTHSSIPTSPPLGILPVCFSSQSDCEQSTHNCSGHGSCKLKNENSKDGAIGGRCFSCACEASVREDSDGGRKTTYWGGPACQKKDISTEFWLLTGFTIVLVSVVAWAIGLLMSMGSEELPSVIGAGVASTGARGK